MGGNLSKREDVQPPGVSLHNSGHECKWRHHTPAVGKRVHGLGIDKLYRLCSFVVPPFVGKI